MRKIYDKDSLGNRMKLYEDAAKSKLLTRTPVAIRLDGKAFHTFTKHFNKPFDDIFVSAMQKTMKSLCENIQNCAFGYTQSDEITLILVDDKELNTSTWYDNQVQKLCSVSASMATLYFNKWLEYELLEYELFWVNKEENLRETRPDYYNYMKAAVDKGAFFDARCFNVPKDDITNLIFWRQVDAKRNSVRMFGYANFSHKSLEKMSNDQLKEKLLEEKDIDWNMQPSTYKWGSCCYKTEWETTNSKNDNVSRGSYWEIDNDMPYLKGEDYKFVMEKIYGVVDNGK